MGEKILTQLRHQHFKQPDMEQIIPFGDGGDGVVSGKKKNTKNKGFSKMNENAFI